MKYYLGIDIGTSGCKAVIFSLDGVQISLAYREYNIISKDKGLAELNTNEVMEKCFDVIKESSSQVSEGSIVGMGISSQGEAFTMIDRKGKALCNAFVSSDTRADSYVKNWSDNFGVEKLYQITGHTPHPMFSLFKILWVKDNLPHIFKKIHKILCFEDLLQYRLGIKESSMGWPLAGRTMLFDVRNHCWSKDIMDAVGIHPEQLSRPLLSGSLSGYIDSDIAKYLGLSKHTFVVTGGHDQPCSALGAGAIDSGMAVYATGTVECITPAFSSPVFSEELQRSNFCTYDHAAPGIYATVAFSLTGGNLFKWFRDEFGYKEKEDAISLNKDAYELLLENIPVQPSNLLVFPYFTPSGTPYFNTTLKGAIFGLDLSTKRGEILKALLEGVALEIKLNLEILENSGYIVNELRAIGGGARSQILNQLKASVINRPITTINITEAGCMGVAMLAAAFDTGQRVYDLSKQWVRPISKVLPKDSTYYNNKFIEYKKLYPMLKSIRDQMEVSVR